MFLAVVLEYFGSPNIKDTLKLRVELLDIQNVEGLSKTQNLNNEKVMASVEVYDPVPWDKHQYVNEELRLDIVLGNQLYASYLFFAHGLLVLCDELHQKDEQEHALKE